MKLAYLMKIKLQISFLSLQQWKKMQFVKLAAVIFGSSIDELTDPLHSGASTYRSMNVFVFYIRPGIWLKTVQVPSFNIARHFCSTANVMLGVWGDLS